MKKIAIALLLPLCSVAALAQTSKKPTTTTKKATATKSVQKPIAKPAFKTTLDSASYSFGITMASSMKKDGLNALNYDLLVQGLKDAFNDKPFALTTQGSQSAINNLFATLSKKKFGPAIAEGTAFLENNKKTTRSSGYSNWITIPGNYKRHRYYAQSYRLSSCTL